ncbi:MAG: ribonuclease PH [Myxococcota bacterium]
MRHDGRAPNQLRPCSIEPGFITRALGSALVQTGVTRVICTASVQERAPSWLKEGGWVSAQYAMLPGATTPRGRRDSGGRGQEIQRLIARSLRASVDLSALVDPEGNPISVMCDCDVIEADGGTRTASITGAYVALKIALSKLQEQGRLPADPVRAAVAAVSVGLLEGKGGPPQAVLDLDYPEDRDAVVDLNVVAMTGGGLVEVQGTGEHGTYSRAQLNAMLDLADEGIAKLHATQQEALR